MQALKHNISDGHDHNHALESTSKLSQDLNISLRLNPHSNFPSTTLESKHDPSGSGGDQSVPERLSQPGENSEHRHCDQSGGGQAVSVLERLSEPGENPENHHDHDDNEEDEDVYADAVDNVEDENEDKEEFSFVCGANKSPISAEDAFMNGQIKPSFPLFGMDLFLGDDEEDRVSIKPRVKKVFVEMKNNYNKDDESHTTSSSTGNDEIMGPYCQWSKKVAVEVASAEAAACRKSNSTGFSKLWRFKEFRNRSSSDGKDAFVFLNNHGMKTTPSGGSNESKVYGRKEKVNDVKGKVNEGKGKAMKGGEKNKTSSLSAHGAYMKSKAKEDDRRRSYLPYKPEVVGFFTNVKGGVSKNVHPF